MKSKKPLKPRGDSPASAFVSLPIEFDQARYEALVRALHVAGTVYGLLGDLADEGYKKRSGAMDDLMSWVLANAGAFGMAGDVEIFEAADGASDVTDPVLNVLTEAAMDRYADDLEEYEEFVFWDVLAHKLTDRELARRRARGELAGMGKQDIMRLHAELEDRFGDELDKRGLDGFEPRHGAD